jgi:transcriptional regulatory protein LevR
MRRAYPIEYEVAREALLQFRAALGVTLPESETDVLTVLLANAETLLSNEQSTVGIVVATYGRGVAAGMAELANTLVGGNFVRWVELTLEQSPEELLTQVIHWVRAADQGSGVLLFVDFTSLLSLGEMITRQTGMQVNTIAGVSTSLLLEAVQRAQRSRQLTLEQLSASLVTRSRGEQLAAGSDGQESVSVGHLKEERGRYEASFGNEYLPRVILSVCLTGFGSAAKIAELLVERLPNLSEQGVEIICMDISLSSKTEADIQRLVGNRQVVAVVGTINPHLEHYPFIALTEFLFGDGQARLRTLLGSTLIDPALLHPFSLESEEQANEAPQPLNASTVLARRADLMHAITSTLSQRMIFLNPTRIMPLIERTIELITVRQQVEQLFARELSICRRALHILSTQITRTLPDEEAYNIVGILRQVDIFAVDAERQTL